MQRSRLLLGVASVLAGTTALLVVLGAVYNLLFAVLAAPFAVAAYFLWYHATGRLGERVRARARDRRARRRARASPDGRGRARGDRSRREAARVLGVGVDAGRDEIRRAYRERVKEVHPDADGGSEEAFKRVNDAYERLRE